MNEWPLWEVFIRSQHGLAHKHVGSLHAPDAEMAIKNARAMNKFGERGDAPIRPTVPMSPTTSGFVAGERKSGGRVIDGEATKGDIKKWGNRAKGNSYFRGGAATGVGREEKAEHMERRRGEKT